MKIINYQIRVVRLRSEKGKAFDQKISPAWRPVAPAG